MCGYYKLFVFLIFILRINQANCRAIRRPRQARPPPYGQPPPGQPMPAPGQPMPPGMPMPGQPMPPGMPMPGQPMPGQPMPPGMPMPGQPMPPGMPMPGQPMPPGMQPPPGHGPPPQGHMPPPPEYLPPGAHRPPPPPGGEQPGINQELPHPHEAGSKLDEMHPAIGGSHDASQQVQPGIDEGGFHDELPPLSQEDQHKVDEAVNALAEEMAEAIVEFVEEDEALAEEIELESQNASARSSAAIYFVVVAQTMLAFYSHVLI